MCFNMCERYMSCNSPRRSCTIHVVIISVWNCWSSLFKISFLEYSLFLTFNRDVPLMARCTPCNTVRKCVSDLRRVGVFLRVIWFPPQMKLITTKQLKYC